MEHLIGNKVWVSLKNDEETLCGILIHVEEYYVYIQMENSTNLYIVPKHNVKYYVTNNFSATSRVLPTYESEQQEQPQPQQQQVQQPGFLTVFINGDHIIDIPTPSTFRTDVFSDDIMRVALGNPDVQSILAGRRQKQVEYHPGKLYITTVTEEEEGEEITPPSNPGSQNTFSMGGNLGKQFMSGQQMVDMLNSAVRKQGVDK